MAPRSTQCDGRQLWPLLHVSFKSNILMLMLRLFYLPLLKKVLEVASFDSQIGVTS